MITAEEIKYQKACVTSITENFPQRIAARTPNESNQNPSIKYTVSPVCGEKERKSRNVPSLIATLLIKRNMEVTSTERPVCGHESTKRCVLTPKHVDDGQTGTVRPVLVDRKEELEINFRVPRLSHAFVQKAEHLRVQELVKRIENLPHREALHSDSQQNNFCNPFRLDSKSMTRELVYVKVIRVVRNYTKSTMFTMSSLLESKDCVLHLRTMLDLQ